MRLVKSATLIAALGGAAACGSDSTGPVSRDRISDFVYVSNQNGSDQLFAYSAGSSALLPGSQPGDKEPQSAHGRIVFTGYRDSPTNSEIYSVKNDGSDAHRLTTNGALDSQPSPSPDGSSIVFVSLRSGTSRLWTMESDGSNPAQMTTASPDYTPESAPRFSPDGTKILFDSPRTGTSQLFIMPAAGGDATQLTHESNGAFDGSWSSDGASVYYVDGANRRVVHKIIVSSGAVSEAVSSGVDVGEPACNGAVCLIVSGRTTASGDIYAYPVSGSQDSVLVVGISGNERQPAFLVP